MIRTLLTVLIASGVLFSCTLPGTISTCNIPVEITKDAFDIKPYFRPPYGEVESGQYKQMLDAKWMDTYLVTSIDTSMQRQVGSCADYAQTPLPQWEPSTPSDFAPYQLMSVKCKLLTLLAKATPSKMSFVKDVKVNEVFIKSLPKSLAYITSTSEFDKIMAQTSTSKLGEVSRVLSVMLRAHKTAEVRVPGGMQIVTVVAMGDFNQDSVEDMLLLVNNSSLEGTYDTSNAVVITRMKAGENFQIVVP
jgi:hypothetical protein